MISERIIELVNKEIDGFSTQEENSELQEIISRDESARHYLDEHRKLRMLFDSAPLIAPPDSIKETVMAAIEWQGKQESSPAPTSVSKISELRELIASGFGRRSFFPAAAGLAAGILLTSIFWFGQAGQGFPDGSELAGSMLPVEGASEYTVEGVKTITFENETIQLRFGSAGGNSIIEWFSDSPEEIALVMRPTNSNAVPVAVSRLNSDGGTVRIENKVVTFWHLGANQYRVIFENAENVPTDYVIEAIVNRETKKVTITIGALSSRP